MIKPSTFDYKGATVLITGASGGLGEAFPEQLAARGCNLVLVSRSEEKLRSLARRLERQNNIGATIFFAWVALATPFQGVIVWPVVILHAVISIALALSLSEP